MEKDRKRSAISSILHGSLITFSSFIVIGGINYLVRRTLVLNLTDVEYGFFYSAFSFVSLFLTFFELGLGQSATILIAKYNSLKDQTRINCIFSTIFWIKLSASLLLFVVLSLLSPWLMRHFFNFDHSPLPFILLCLYMITISMKSNISFGLDGFQDFGWRSLIQMTRVILLYLIVLLGISSWGLNAVSIAFVISSFIAFIIGAFRLFRTWHVSLSRQLSDFKIVWQEIWHFARWVAISVAGLCMMYYMDTLMLTYFKGLKSVALYNIALPIMQIVQSLTIIPVVFAPIATELWHKKRTYELREIINCVIICLYWLVPGLIIFLLFCSKLIITLLFTSKYNAASGALIILCGGMPLLVIANFLMNSLSAMEKPKTVSKIIIIGVIVNTVSNALLIPLWDIQGAATATAFSYLVICFFSYKNMSKLLKIKLEPLKFSVITVAGVLITIAAIFIELHTENSWFKVIISLGLIALYAMATSPIMIKVLFRMYKLRAQTHCNIKD